MEAIAFSVVNFVLTCFWSLPLLQSALAAPDADDWLRGTRGGHLVVLSLIGPLCLGVVLGLLDRWSEKNRLTRAQRQRPWDNVFRRREPGWIVIHLADGQSVGGWFGKKSMASSAPAAKALYVEQVWRLDAGRLVAPVEWTDGILIEGDRIWAAEFFHAQAPAEAGNSEQSVDVQQGEGDQDGEASHNPDC